MTFELFTTAPADPFPAMEDISVRFLFHNHTTTNTSEPVVYPLFGQQARSLSWMDFVTGMDEFAIGSQAQWCQACGNTTGICASSTSSSGSSPAATPAGSSSGGISRAVAGVIGAMVTLAVILGAEALVMLVGGFRLIDKRRLGAQNAARSEVAKA